MPQPRMTSVEVVTMGFVSVVAIVAVAALIALGFSEQIISVLAAIVGLGAGYGLGRRKPNPDPRDESAGF